VWGSLQVKRFAEPTWRTEALRGQVSAEKGGMKAKSIQEERELAVRWIVSTSIH
jgi:hypothetical protein